MNRLLEEAAELYHRHVVAALFHIVEDRGFHSQWQAE